jgi:RNA polymerase sigma factor (sigma-70 family)
MSSNDQLLTKYAINVSERSMNVEEFLARDDVQSMIQRVGRSVLQDYPDCESYKEGYDLAQRINMRLMKQFTFIGRNGCSFETFIRLMANNLCKDDCNRSNRREVIESTFYRDREEHIPSTFIDRVYLLNMEIGRYCERWPKDETLIKLWMRSALGIEVLTLEEIAFRVGLSSKTVSKRIEKCRKELMPRLEQVRFEKSKRVAAKGPC